MRRPAPIITLLSPSRDAANRAQTWLAGFTTFLRDENSSNSALIQEDDLESKKGLFSHHLTSSLSVCERTGTHLHFLSSSKSREGRFELIGLHQAATVSEVREEVAASLSNPFKRWLLSFLGYEITARRLLDKNEMLLSIDEMMSQTLGSDESIPSQGVLKEIAVPVSTENFSSRPDLRASLASSSLFRPVIGLYSISDSLCIRPLPVASSDLNMSLPTLIFHVDNYAERSEEVIKIGFNGSRKGQLLLNNCHLPGLDVRLCCHTKRTSVFAEGHESLLAGSLDELQSSHVMEGASGSLDPKVNKVDCWVEFRANVVKPSGFIARKSA